MEACKAELAERQTLVVIANMSEDTDCWVPSPELANTVWGHGVFCHHASDNTALVVLRPQVTTRSEDMVWGNVVFGHHACDNTAVRGHGLLGPLHGLGSWGVLPSCL
jgi:hypothetical protein